MSTSATDGAQRLRAYLERKGLDPFFRRVRDRFVQRSGTGASVPIEDEERDALGGFLGRRVTTDRVHLRDIEAALVQSSFPFESLRGALEAYTGEALTTREERRQARRSAWQSVRDDLEGVARAGAAEEDVMGWLAAESSYLRGQWGRSRASFPGAAATAIRALHRARELDGVRLAVLANDVAGDPHALDLTRGRGMPAATRYFRSLLRSAHPAVADEDLPAAEAWARLLAAEDVLIDDVSSDVLVAGLCGDPELVSAARRAGDVLKLTMRNLDAWDGAVLRAHEGVAYLVENPSVFSDLCDALEAVAPEARPTLVCTSGHPSLAVRELLDRLVEQGAGLRYSGDFDERGLAIARFFLDRYDGSLSPWRMTPAAYAEALGEEVSRPAPRQGEAPFEQLGPLIRQYGAAYQEALAPLLADDLLSPVTHLP